MGSATSVFRAQTFVMPGLVPGIHAFFCIKNVDGRDKPGHDVAYDWMARRRRLCRRALLVLPVLDEIFDHGGVGQRRGVAEATRFVLGDLAQDAAHDLAGAGFGQARRKLDLVER